MGDEKKGKSEEELPFDATQDPAWAERVDSWRWEERDSDTRIKVGECERCEHTISVVDRTDVVARMTAVGTGRPRRFAACNCGVTHPDTPDDQEGCGANGLVERPEKPAAGSEP